MITLHITIHKGKPCLWSEGKNWGNIKELRRALKAIGLGLKVLKSNTTELAAWLPSSGGSPIPSSPLMGSKPQNHKTVLSAYDIVTLPLDIRQVLALGTIFKGGNITGTGILLGSSIDWISNVLNMALKLVAEENFLPAISRHAGCWEARWVPVPTSQDEQKLEKLARKMPAVCRCANCGGKIPDMPSHLIMNVLLAKSVDTLIRGSACSPKKGSQDSLHDAWIDALDAPDAQVKWGDGKNMVDFSNCLTDWVRPVDTISMSPFRFLFRLSEPENSQDHWRVDYLLQPKSDQSTYIPVSGLWHKKSKAAEKLKSFDHNPIEFVLTALGQASRLCPDISKSLKQKNPGGFHLDAYGAYSFLKEYAQSLSDSGYGVLLPSWWVGNGPAKKLGVKVKAKSSQMQPSSGFTLDSMVEFDYRMSMGGQELTPEELASLAKMKAPLVKIRGQWMQTDAQQIHSAIRLLQKKKDKLDASGLLAAALGSSRQIENLPIDSVEATGWLKELIDRLTGQAAYEQMDQPQQLKGKLRPYQIRGFSWLAFLGRWGLGACLADDMGLGKTIQALAFMQRSGQSKEGRPSLVICPTSVVHNWLKEAQIFAPALKVLVHHGSDRRKKTRFINSAKKHDMVISSYGLLHRDIGFLKEVDWSTVILDEAQNIKNPEAKQSKAARSLKAECRIALTGTPVENHVGDLWALMDFLNPGLLGSQAYFKNTFYKPIQVYHKQDARKKLKSVTAPFILRRLKTDRSIISDLPDKIEIKDYCHLTKEQAALYQAVVGQMQEKIKDSEGINRKGLVLSTIMKLKQVCNHPAQYAQDNSSVKGRSGKLQRLEKMLEEVIQLKESTLIFTQFAHMGSLLQKHLQDYFAQEVLLLTGSLSKKVRDQMVQRFQNSKNNLPIFILSLKAGGTGLNLTRANHVIHYDRWWNPAVENQATDRAFRIGQNKKVTAHKFIVAGTLEERIDEMIEKKMGVASQVIGTGEKWLTELSDQDLYQLVKLGCEAKGE